MAYLIFNPLVLDQQERELMTPKDNGLKIIYKDIMQQ